MDAAPLRLSERLRPWHAAGLRYLFRNRTQTPPPAGEKPGKNAYQPAPAVDSENTWPAPWDSYRNRLEVPSRTVWTYADLCLDFGSSPSPERRNLFLLIIHFLKWPKGSVTFWPVAAERAGRLEPDAERFWQGVAECRARTVVVFGRRALDILFPGEAFAPRIFQARGVNVVVLPGPSDLLPDNRQAKKIVWDTLRSLSIA